jgi:hypothetical protein
MQSSKYIEDIYLEVFENVLAGALTGYDVNPACSFYTLLESKKPVTQAQADYIIRLLTKYQSAAIKAGVDYSQDLAAPKWKSQFRVIDQSKQVHIEKDEHGAPQICLKFPFQLKKEFDAGIDHFEDDTNHSRWDSDRKLRILSLYRFNIIHIYDFVKKHNFIIDDSFLEIIGQVEEIWQQEDNIIPSCGIVDSKVEIKNVSNEILAWWNEHKNGVVENDLLLAKHMRLKFLGGVNSLVENIVSSASNIFWIKDISKFLDLCDKIQGCIVIVLDRSYDAQTWVRDFIAQVDTTSFNKSDIKVCFRSKREKENGFNEWIKEQGLGGTVETGKILIFDNKPAKWLFTQPRDVKLLVMNNLFPHTQTMTRDWINSHPCVIYLGDIKPTLFKDRSIVEL